MSKRLAQQVALVAMVDPVDSGASNTTTCDVIDASLYDSLMFVMAVGAVTSSGKYTMTVYKGTTSTVGSITSSVTSAVLTCTGLAATFEDNAQAIIDVDVSHEGNYRYYKAQVVESANTTTGGKTVLMVFGGKSRVNPATDNDLASVKRITYA
jgi:hypothetical protein